MAPEDKAVLVQKLQEFLKTEVGMCGDGANDCAALKTADVGISLSEAEASIAAPFSSKILDISAVVILLKEGKCALTTSFSTFKLIELYSWIQFSSSIILYYLGTNYTDFEWFYQDIFVMIPLTMFIGWTEASDKLSAELP